MKRTLFLDVGHSTRFPGANGVRNEVEWVRLIWSRLQPKLDVSKWEIQPVPEFYKTDWLGSNFNLVQRIRFINKRCKDGDWVLSLHGNAASDKKVRGITTCYMGGSEYAKHEAEKLSKAISKRTGVPVWLTGSFDDRQGRYGQIGMVRQTRPMALLVENGFVTNVLDMYSSPDLYAQGIADYFNAL